MGGTVAIVGRPNVGKSALFNRIVGRRIAIVHDQPGVTRDRISAEAEWRGASFTLVDTGGIGLRPGEKSQDAIQQATAAQADLAVASSDLILLVTDAKSGPAPLDEEIAARLRQSGKPVVVAMNKADTPARDEAAIDFAPLGFEDVFPVSALHGRGLPELMDALVSRLPEDAEPASSQAGEADEEPLKLAIVGRPNVGKSSILNALVRSERVVVSPAPGTTRDSVDVPLEIASEGRKERYILIDTAGMRKRRRVKDSIEFYSLRRAEKAIERADIAVFVLDAEAGVLEQDKKIGGKIVEARKGCVLVVNKWDLYAEATRRAVESQSGRAKSEEELLEEFGRWVQRKLFFLDYAPALFVSAKSGLNLSRLLEAVRYVAGQMRQKIPTAVLNRVLREAIDRRQPSSGSGKPLKFFYATQVKQMPPAFLLFLNRAEPFAKQYEKYLVGELRKAFGFEGCPITLIPRARPKKGGALPKEGRGAKAARGRKGRK